MTLIERIGEYMLSDCEDDSERLITLFQNASDDQKKILDDAMICLCGYSLTTLIGGPQS